MVIKKYLLHDVQIRSFIKIIIFSIILLFIYSFFKIKIFLQINTKRSIFFNVISILTGTGYVAMENLMLGEVFH